MTPRQARKHPLSYYTPREYLKRLNYYLFRVERYIDYPQFPFDPELYKIIIFSEDRRFYSHPGVDVIAIGRELVRLVSQFRMFGGSTIDMQFVRTCINRRDRTVTRKLTEILISLIINFKYSKNEIFSAYMRYAYFGYKIVGLDEAIGRLYGGRTDLTMNEKCILAACLVYPIPKNISPEWKNESKAGPL